MAYYAGLGIGIAPTRMTRSRLSVTLDESAGLDNWSRGVMRRRDHLGEPTRKQE